MASTSGASELSGRYAAALFDLADEAKQLDNVADDLRQLEVMIGESEDLQRFARSPVIGFEEQMATMKILLQKINATHLTVRFIGVLTQNRRLFVLTQVISAFLSELSRRRGEISAEVISARGLNNTQRSALAETLKMELGGEVTIKQTVDPSLIGGLIVKVGSLMIDSSLRTQLERLRLTMRGTS